MQKITPFLWFDGKAEEAMNFYMSVFGNSRLVGRMLTSAAGPGPEGSVLGVTFELDGQEFTALNGGPEFSFTPAISLFVNCETQAEVDHYWEKLSAGGAPGRCGWLTDRYGVSWQVVPVVLGRMLRDPDPARTARVAKALYQMTRIDLATLERAYAQ